MRIDIDENEEDEEEIEEYEGWSLLNYIINGRNIKYLQEFILRF